MNPLATAAAAAGAAFDGLSKVAMTSAAAGDTAAAWRLGLRARFACVALALYSFLLANGLAGVQERLLSRG